MHEEHIQGRCKGGFKPCTTESHHYWTCPLASDAKRLAAKKEHISSSTFEGYRKIAELRLVPALGHHLILDLNRTTIKDWLDKLQIGIKTLSNIQSCLRSALNDAVDEEVLDTNPLAGWTYTRKGAPPKDDNVDPFTPEEQQAILAALSNQSRNMVQFALWAGLRTSELVAADWGVVDWVRGKVMISRAMT